MAAFDRPIPPGRVQGTPAAKRDGKGAGAIETRIDSPAASREIAGTPSRTRSADRSRGSASAKGATPRFAPRAPEPGKARSEEAGPDLLGTDSVSPRRPVPGKNEVAPEPSRRDGYGQTAAEPQQAVRRNGKGIPGPVAASSHVAVERRPGSPERAVSRPAPRERTAEGRSFSGFIPAAAGPVQEGRGAIEPAAPAPLEPSREAFLPPPLFEQVAMRMAATPDGAHEVEIRLAPEHLGKLKIELHIDSGRMDAAVRADNPEARSLLLLEEPALREALRNAGVTLSSFNVALSGEPWKERRERTSPNGDTDTAPHRGGKEEKTESVASVRREDLERDGMKRTEHWIA